MILKTTSERDRFYWGQAGSIYYAIDRWQGRIIALLYWTEEQLGGRDGEPVILEPAWLWLPAEEPDYHRDISAPPLTRGMTDAELAAAHDIALEEAGRAILDYLDSRGMLHVEDFPTSVAILDVDDGPQPEGGCDDEG